MNNPSEKSVAIYRQLQDAVAAGYVLIPYHEAGVARVEPWQATTVNYGPDGELIPEPPEGRVIGTQDVDVAVFAAITGYVGPAPVVPAGTARIRQRINRFSKAAVPDISSVYSIATLSIGGKLALRDNEESKKTPTFVYWADATKFEERPGLFPFTAAGSVAIEGGVAVSSEELGVDPYELPAVEAIDWNTGAVAFKDFVRKTQL